MRKKNKILDILNSIFYVRIEKITFFNWKIYEKEE